MFKFITETGLSILWDKIKTLLSSKVDKENEKTLISNEEKEKLAGIEENAEVNEISVIKVNSQSQEIDENKAVNIIIPTKVSDLTNDKNFVSETELDSKNFQTAENVNAAIASALGDVSGLSYLIVTELPQTGEAGVIYLISNNSNTSNNIYDEYIYVSNTFEKIGTTEIDLSGYIEEEVFNTELEKKLDINSNGYVKSMDIEQSDSGSVYLKYKLGNDTDYQSKKIFDNSKSRCKIVIPSDTNITNGYEITLPINYICGNNSLEVFWNGVLLQKASETEDGHYKEVESTGATSNKIQINRTAADGNYTLSEDVILTAIVKNIL